MSFVTFGEIMLRLVSSDHTGKLSDAKSFAVNFAGSESNVASSLAILGNEVNFVTKLPQNQLGAATIRSLNAYGVNTGSVIFGGSRLGTYFIEMGSSIRPSEVIYDRSGSAISEIKRGEFDWEGILKDKSWVFVSGITPALSEQCATEAILLAKIARKIGVKVCFDLNYRRTLWKQPEVARKLFSVLLENTDLLCGNYGSVSDVFQINLSGTNESRRTEQAMDFVQGEFGVSLAAFTIRVHESASRNRLSALLKADGTVFSSMGYDVDITDRFGTGDAFAAGLLHGLGKKWSYERAIQFATAAFALKHTIRGDQHTSSEKEIISIMNGQVSGHVIR